MEDVKAFEDWIASDYGDTAMSTGELKWLWLAACEHKEKQIKDHVLENCITVPEEARTYLESLVAETLCLKQEVEFFKSGLKQMTNFYGIAAWSALNSDDVGHMTNSKGYYDGKIILADTEWCGKNLIGGKLARELDRKYFPIKVVIPAEKTFKETVETCVGLGGVPEKILTAHEKQIEKVREGFRGIRQTLDEIKQVLTRTNERDWNGRIEEINTLVGKENG